MSTFSSISIPIPKDWQAFERQSRILFECILGDPHTQTNGRQGQRQNGVDIFGHRGGGEGPLVGVQCKGKDGNYRQPVTEAELRNEIKKAQGFKPPLDEFILITTARDDQNIQTTARLLEKELRDGGQQISISVWGWDTLEQRISEHARALKAFLPDAAPYTEKLLEGQQLIIQSHQRQEDKLDFLVAQHKQQTVISTDARKAIDAIDSLLHDEIDQYRTLIQDGKIRTALALLEALKKRVWDKASERVRFRILSNIGAAYHNLRNYPKAAELFLEAAPYDPDNPIAISNKIAALLIKGERADAHTIAVEASIRFPNSREIALQRIQARKPGELVTDVCGALSATVRFHADILFVKILAMRDDSDLNWREEAHRALSTHPNDDRFRRIEVEAFLDQLFEHDPALLGSQCGAFFDEEKLRAAASVFQHAWDESLAREDGADASAAHNGAVVYFVLRLKKEAIDLADAVISRGIAFDETKKMRANFYLQDNHSKEAIDLVKSMKSSVERDLWLAQALVDIDASQARQLAERSEANLTNDGQRIVETEIIVDSYIKESNWSPALARVEQLNLRIPNHPIVPLLKYRILKAQDDKSAVRMLLEARDRLVSNTDFIPRYLIAQELELADLHDEAASVLEDHIDLSRDSSALRLFITAAFNADRRATVATTISHLSNQIADREFFLRMKAAFALRCGEAHEAEAAVRRYLAANPRNLEMHIQLLQILVGRDDKQSLKAELSRPISDFDGSAENWMQLAHFFDTYGDCQKAVALAYSIWLKNQKSPVVNFRYIALFLRPGHSTEMPIALDVVIPDAAFGIRRVGQDERQQFVIEPIEDLRSEPYTVSPEHPIAISALGKRVGDTIDLGMSGQYNIEWIKPKQIYALHNVMETFNLFFPETEGLRRVTIETEGPEKFKPIVDSAKARHDAIARAFDMYEKQHLPIATVAASLGSDPVETFLGLIESGRSIRVCVGTHPERFVAQTAIENNKKKGCIVDAVTLYVIRRLNIENEVKAICGPIGIVETTVQRLREKHFHLSARATEPDLSVGWQDGSIYKMEVNVEQKKAVLETIQQDLDWIQGNATVLAAHGLTDAPENLRRVLRKFDVGFADELLAAQAHHRLLLSEDMSYRAVGTELFNLDTTWLQPVLMMARNHGIISQKRYNEGIVAMIQYRAMFISIDKDVLLETLNQVSELPLPKDYRCAADTLGGQDADMRSHISVAFEVIVELWENRLNLLAMAATGYLLNCLFRNQTVEVTVLVRVLRVYARRLITTEHEFLEYLEAWLKGHFFN